MKTFAYLVYSLAGVLSLWPFAQSMASSRCYPVNRFTVSSTGLVQDTLTGLVWQQQPSPTTMTWAAAQTYCSNAGSGFRLPTLKELLSLVDLTVTVGATINQTAFPNTQGEGYWTSTPYTGASSTAWFVYFATGRSLGNIVTGSERVRCVR